MKKNYNLDNSQIVWRITYFSLSSIHSSRRISLNPVFVKYSLTLPEDFKFDYVFPQPLPNRTPEPNSGEFRLRAKYCNVTLSFFNIGWSYVASARFGPSSTSMSIIGIPINPYFQDYVSRHLAEICQVNYMVSFSSEFSSLRLLWDPKTRSYAKFIDKMLNKFQDFFDLEQYVKMVKESAREDALEEIFELLEDIKASVKKEK